MRDHQQQFAKLLPLILISDKAGEICAAAAALRRAIEADGSDPHEFAEIAARAFVTRSSRPLPSVPSVAPWRDRARWALGHHDGRLKPAELEFLCSMAAWRSVPSARQSAWLDAICAALGRQAA